MAVRQMGLKARLHGIEFGHEEVKRLERSTMMNDNIIDLEVQRYARGAICVRHAFFECNGAAPREPRGVQASADTNRG